MREGGIALAEAMVQQLLVQWRVGRIAKRPLRSAEHDRDTVSAGISSEYQRNELDSQTIRDLDPVPPSRIHMLTSSIRRSKASRGPSLPAYTQHSHIGCIQLPQRFIDPRILKCYTTLCTPNISLVRRIGINMHLNGFYTKRDISKRAAGRQKRVENF